MAGEDWFRNTTWNDDVARSFNQKLRRARDKQQCLRLQAGKLASSHPEVALELLERYFALPDDLFDAEAYVVRATALRALGKPQEAAAAYEDALAQEAEFPTVVTQAYLELPLLVATAPLPQQYDRALAVLHQHQDRITFPVELFLWTASRALILAAQGQHAAAQASARQALEAARSETSGFRHHPTVGLVGDEHKPLLKKLMPLAED
jgi:tetratricopeptide (TPR) repeat protein